MKPTFCKPVVCSFLVIGSVFLSPSILFAKSQKANEFKNEIPTNFISDGNSFLYEKENMSITPPVNWRVRLSDGNGPSVIMEETKETVKKRNPSNTYRTQYRRNITVSVKHQGIPIDEQSAELLSAELVKKFSKNAMIRDYSVLEKKVFDYKENSKGLLVYTTFRLNNVEMMQMHMLVSGDNRQYLQTYTDLASRFNPEDEGFTQAWASMSALGISGKAPVRFEELIRFGAITGGLFLFFMMAFFIRRRSNKKNFSANVSNLESGDFDSDYSLVSNTAWDLAEEEDGYELTNASPEQHSWIMPRKTVRTQRVNKKEVSSSWITPVKTMVTPRHFSSNY